MLKAFVIALLLIAPGHVQAFTVTQTGATFTVQYTEPTTNADGTPLTDLERTTIYTKVGTATEIVDRTVPATALTGGGIITQSVSVTITPGIEVDVTISVTASDQSANESSRISVTRRVDKLAPAPPQ